MHLRYKFLLVLFSIAPFTSHAEEGMFPLNAVPKAEIKKQYGFEKMKMTKGNIEFLMSMKI